MILYLLPFKDKAFFKFGITKNNISYDRIKTLHHKYNFDLDNSFIVSCKKNRLIEILEKEIKATHDFEIPTCYIGIDGATEIRPLDILENILDNINYKKNKQPSLEINITKGVEFKTLEADKKNIVLSSNETKICWKNKSVEDILYFTKLQYLENLKNFNRYFISCNNEFKYMIYRPCNGDIIFRKSYKLIKETSDSNNQYDEINSKQPSTKDFDLIFENAQQGMYRRSTRNKKLKIEVTHFFHFNLYVLDKRLDIQKNKEIYNGIMKIIFEFELALKEMICNSSLVLFGKSKWDFNLEKRKTCFK
jgi:hypothetical protein